MDNISNCGLACNECRFYKTKCDGCYKVNGITFWANELEDKICPIYKCCINEKGYKNCGDCNELPCDTFTKLKEPGISDDEHLINIKNRINRLKLSKKK